MCPIHGPGNDMNLFKVIQSQSKSMKSTWLTSRGGGSGCVQLQGAKKRLDKGQYMNSLVASTVSDVLKHTNHAKSATMYDSGLEDDTENFTL